VKIRGTGRPSSSAVSMKSSDSHHPRVFFDTNAGTHTHGYILWFDQSTRDLAKIDDGLREGLIVELYMTDELEIVASLSFDTDLGFWRAMPI